MVLIADPTRYGNNSPLPDIPKMSHRNQGRLSVTSDSPPGISKQVSYLGGECEDVEVRRVCPASGKLGSRSLAGDYCFPAYIAQRRTAQWLDHRITVVDAVVIQ